MDKHNHGQDEKITLLTGDLACSCCSEHKSHEECCNDGGCKLEKKRRIPEVFLRVALAGTVFALGYLPAFAPYRLFTAAAAVLVCGYDIFFKVVRNLIKLKLDEQVLMTIAVIAALIIHEYDEAILVTVLFKLGDYLEDLAVDRSRRSVEALVSIRPDTANVYINGEVRTVAAGSVETGTDIMVRKGEKIPIDSHLISQSATLDCSALTGESMPVSIFKGELARSGSVNLGEVIYLKTALSYEDSSANRIIRLVAKAYSEKGRAERIVTRFARYYTPAVLLAAVMFAGIGLAVNPAMASDYIYRSLVFLVASCPCALVIAVPLAFYSGIGAASRAGVLIKGSRYVEALARVRNAVFDKTGTLTAARQSVESVRSFSELTEDRILELAAVCEQHSSHPVAQAIVNAAGGTTHMEVSDYEEVAGSGVRLRSGSDAYVCGSYKFMRENGISTPDESAGVYIAKNGALLGHISTADLPRQDAAQTVKYLHKNGIGVHMLSGDGVAAASKTAEALGIHSYRHSLMPEQKLSELAAIKQSGTTMFVGDGINDSPALALADVGVAMGFGTDAAIESSDVVLISDRLSSVADALSISKKTAATARFNMIFALSVKAAVILLGVFGITWMWLAVFADVGVSILAVLNSVRILNAGKTAF